MLEWIAENYQPISVGFGSLAALWALVRLLMSGIEARDSYIENNQRMRFQAEFFDRNHQVILDLQKDVAALRENYAANNGRVIDRD